jgi:hypothetical protein
MKLVTTLRALAILSMVVAALFCFCPNVRAEAPGNKTVRFDRAVFGTDTQNSGVILQDRDGFLWVGTTTGGCLDMMDMN